MEHGEPRKGMKVVPHDKTVGDSRGLENSKHYQRMLAKPRQRYLYVVGISPKGNCYLNTEKRKARGDLFAPSDFSLFQAKVKVVDDD